MNKLKQLLPIAAMSFVGISSTLCAVDDMQMRNLENRVSALEQRRGANGMINPPTRPVVKHGSDVWTQLDLLYFHPTEDSLTYVSRSASTATNGWINTQVQDFSFDWNFGWRLGIGYNLPHDGWDTVVSYTRFRSHHKEKTAQNSNEVLVPFYPISTASVTGSVNSAIAKGSLKFDYLDWQLGREFFVSKWLILRPFMGVRGFWSHRPLHVNYTVQSTTTSAISQVDAAVRYRAGGALAGLDSQWGLGMGLSVFSQADVSLLYGKTRLHDKQYQTALDGKTFLTTGDDEQQVWSIMHSMVDLGLGIRWDRLLSDDNYRVRVQLGWEEHLVSNYYKGDLALSGVSLQARLDF
ncbi:Lpg1974 family pore-forming outer membrane protein [Rhabdochlamydiaceae symbiont of Dictyostelium giganteum]|uniref:Lpg1974 family pore-forming outer membrane protein n=1 Tax=Rhabdochlamydiaceae symbiont of Dictyostelium giganteum TaxID=3342349 RepID=UPI00384B10C6